MMAKLIKSLLMRDRILGSGEESLVSPGVSRETVNLLKVPEGITGSTVLTARRSYFPAVFSVP
jgi:hypothetical protein